MRYGLSTLVLLLSLGAASAPAARTPGELLEQLASEDPQKRAEASEQIVAVGGAARPAVLGAMGADASPEVRARAAELILKLPWAQDGDPPEVRQILGSYGQQEPEMRRRHVDALASLKGDIGLPAVVRLLREDPSDLVRWQAAARLHEAVAAAAGPAAADRAVLTPLLALDADREPAPVLAGMALAHRWTDATRARQLYQAASDRLEAGAASREVRLLYGELLLDHGVRGLARRELEAAIRPARPEAEAEAPPLPPQEPLAARPAQGLSPILEANAHFQLASLIGADDDALAAEHLRQGLAAFDRIDGAGLTVRHGNAEHTGDDALRDLRAEMHWRSYRAATKGGKADEAKRHLDRLLALNPQRVDVVLEVVPALKEMNRPDDAKALFERAYAPLRAAVDAGDPAKAAEAMNNLAWLCARCGERLEEAARYADKAVSLSPDNPAYLDTAAEAHFRLGHRRKAIDLESRALRLRPGDEFMQQQLRRFQTAER